MVISTLTGLVTEAIKKVLTEHNKKYHANTLAGIVATVLSAAIGVGYVIITSTAFTPQIIVYIVALIFMGWLCAMVGYDKVVGQFKNTKNSEEE
jgi:putative Mn2+ efflux pump MntP